MQLAGIENSRYMALIKVEKEETKMPNATQCQSQLKFILHSYQW